MVVEFALLRAKDGEAHLLRRGLETARGVISRADGYIGSVFYAGIEEPDQFILVIQWKSLEAHMEGFRNSALLGEWRSHFAAHLAEPPKMTHYSPFTL